MKKIVFIVIASCWVLLLFGQLQRVEPPFWWANMNRSQVQLLLYGKNISEYEVDVDLLEVVEVTHTENPNYLFLTIETQYASAGSYAITLKSKGKKNLTYDFILKSRKEGSAGRIGFNSADAIYLLMPDRFANGDTKNDSHSQVQEQVNRNLMGGRHGGDIEGIIKNLDYIKSLGMTALWSTPLCEDNDKEYSYHGYAQSNVYQIDPRYGSNEDYLRLGQELHSREMKLILDYVTNHWGMQHWLIEDLPAYDWINQWPGYHNTSYRMTTQFDPNAAKTDIEECVQGWFVPSMPDLNQKSPLTLNYLIQNAIWWIEYADLDGLRVDTYSYGDKRYMAEWTKAIMEEYPQFNIVGEVWYHDQAQISYWQKNSPVAAIQNFNTYLPSVMDFTLHDAIMESFKENEAAWNQGMIKIYENFTNDFLYQDSNNLLVFAENHDTARINELYSNLADYKLIMTLIATIRGIPQLYYGSEIGMKGKKEVGDGDIRRDFPGGWPGDPNNAFVPEGRSIEQEDYYRFTSQLFNWRKSAQVIHQGKTKHYVPYNNVYVYFRYLEKKSVMIILNNSLKTWKWSPDRYKESLSSYTAGTDVLSGKKYSLNSEWELAPKSALILELK